MRTTLAALVVVGLGIAQTVVGTERVSMAQRNIEWSVVTLNKIEKDLVGLCKSENVPVPASLADRFQELRKNAQDLSKRVAEDPSRDRLTVAARVARMAAGAVTMIDERVEWIDELRSRYREEGDEDKRLANQGLEGMLEQAVQSLVTSLIAELGSTLRGQKGEAAGAAIEAEIAASRFDLALDTAWEALEIADERAELVEEMRDVGLVPDLDEFNAAAAKMKAARQKTQQIEIRRLQVDMQQEMLEAKKDAMDEALEAAEEVRERAEDDFEEVVDSMWEKVEKAEEEEDGED